MKNPFDRFTLPKEPIQISPAQTITNCEVFIKRNLSVIENAPKDQNIEPYKQRLRALYNILKARQVK